MRIRDEHRSTFVSVVGQADNIGDSALRRELLRALRTPKSRLHIYVADHDEKYVSGLGLEPLDTIYSSGVRWAAQLAKETLAGSANYAYNAGETQPTKRRALNWLGAGVCIAGIRVGGGTGSHTGVGLRSPSTPHSSIFRLALMSSTVVTWRDSDSAAAAGIGNVAPDWAFAAGSDEQTLTADIGPGSRPYLTIAMRFDRPLPSQVWLDSMLALSEKHGLTILLVPQVARDLARAAYLAPLLGGAQVVPWLDSSHAAQEDAVRSLYRQSLITVSDRLHALVFAATEGAIPIGFATGSADKLTRTLRTGGILDVSLSQETATLAQATTFIESAVSRRHLHISAVIESRKVLQVLTERLRTR